MIGMSVKPINKRPIEDKCSKPTHNSINQSRSWLINILFYICFCVFSVHFARNQLAFSIFHIYIFIWIHHTMSINPLAFHSVFASVRYRETAFMRKWKRYIFKIYLHEVHRTQICACQPPANGQAFCGFVSSVECHALSYFGFIIIWYFDISFNAHYSKLNKRLIQITAFNCWYQLKMSQDSM